MPIPKKPFFILAPMDDVTDVVFRRIVAECAAPDMFFTEFVNVDGLQSVGRSKVLNKLKKHTSEHTTVAQIWGKTPENYYKTAKELVQMGFAGIDINMGCPEKSIVKNGCCSAFMLPENQSLASQVIKAVQSAVNGKVPVSVKTRLGFNEVDYGWHKLLLQHNLNMLTIHARTRKEMSKVPADWAKLEPIVALRDKLSPATLIVGNGDVTSRAHGLELAKKHGVDGVMIGRGIFTDPFVFAVEDSELTHSERKPAASVLDAPTVRLRSDARFSSQTALSSASSGSPWACYTKEQKIALLKRHVELYQETWQPGERNFDMLKKFAKVYINGFDGASDMRVHVMACKSAPELLQLITTF